MEVRTRLCGILGLVFACGCGSVVGPDEGVDGGQSLGPDASGVIPGDPDAGGIDPGDPADAGMSPDAQPLEPGNTAPSVNSLTLPSDVDVGASTSIGCVASDPDGDSLTYTWSVTGGTLQQPAAASTSFVAPYMSGDVSITCSVDDGGGGTASRAELVSVELPRVGLLGSYVFSGSATDSSGNGNHGTVVGATFTADRHGDANSALSFDGNDYVQLANESDFDLDTITVSAWINTGASNDQRVIVAKGSLAQASNYGNFTLLVYEDDQQFIPRRLSYVAQVPSGNYSAGSNYTVPLQTHLHVAMTRDASALRFYVDGALVRTVSNPSAPSMNNDPVTIGRGAYGDFVGSIDDLRIYDRVLSADEIAAIAAD